MMLLSHVCLRYHSLLRAYDKKTGAIIWETTSPVGPIQSLPSAGSEARSRRIKGRGQCIPLLAQRGGYAINKMSRSHRKGTDGVVAHTQRYL